MRDRRRHLVGPRRRCSLALAASPAAAAATARRGAPSPRRPQKPFYPRRPTDARAADRPPRSQPQRLHGARGAELARLHAPLLRPLGRRGARRPRPRPTRNGDGIPDFVEQVRGSPNTSTRSRTASSAGASPKSDGRKGGARRQDRRLPRRRSAASLFGYAAPDRGQATKRHRLPRRLHGYLVLDNDYDRLRVPGDEAARRPRGDLRPRVQPHPPVRLRRLPGRLVRRVDRDLDGGPGLQRHQRLPALRAALGASSTTRR